MYTYKHICIDINIQTYTYKYTYVRTYSEKETTNLQFLPLSKMQTSGQLVAQLYNFFNLDFFGDTISFNQRSKKSREVGKVGVRQHLQFLSKRGKLCFLPQLSFPWDQLCLNLNCILIYKIYTKEREIMLSQSLGVGLCPWGQLLCLSTATQNYNWKTKYMHTTEL